MGKIRKIVLPGVLVAATGVGAGDLITAGLAGIKVGYLVLWAVVLGVILKWALTEGIARWQLATQTTLLEGWTNHLGKWIQRIFFCYLILWSFVVGGALINACGVAGTNFHTLTGNINTGKIVWGILHAVAGIILVRLGGFQLFEKLMAVSIGLMFTTVIITAIAIKPDWGQVFKGLLIPSIPDQGLKWVLSLLGGVGGTVTVLSYGYWITEKNRKGMAGLKESRIDLTVAYGLTGIFSIAMIIIAGNLPSFDTKGIHLAVAIGNELDNTLGTWSKWCFLTGF